MICGLDALGFCVLMYYWLDVTAMFPSDKYTQELLC